MWIIYSYSMINFRTFYIHSYLLWKCVCMLVTLKIKIKTKNVVLYIFKIYVCAYIYICVCNCFILQIICIVRYYSPAVMSISIVKKIVAHYSVYIYTRYFNISIPFIFYYFFLHLSFDSYTLHKNNIFLFSFTKNY